MRLFFETIKSNKNTRNTTTSTLVKVENKVLRLLKNNSKLEIEKSTNTNAKTIIKLIGLDLLKTLVIINSFCIFAP